MKTREELQDVIRLISSEDSPVGMDAVYVHAVILDKLSRIEQRLDRLEGSGSPGPGQQTKGGDHLRIRCDHSGVAEFGKKTPCASAQRRPCFNIRCVPPGLQLLQERRHSGS